MKWRAASAAAVVVAAVVSCSSARVEEPDRILEAVRVPAGDARPVAGVESVGPRPASPAEAPAGGWALDDVLERIAAANPTIGAAHGRLEEAEAARRAAVAAYWPELSLGVYYLSTDDPAQAFALLLDQEKLTLGPSFDPTPGTIENWRKEVRLDWPLFAPGRDEARRAARESEEAARLASEAVERRLLNAGVQGWLGLRAARELADVARESIAVVEQRLEQTRTRRREGAALRADVLRLEVRLAAARQEAARATLAVREAESALNRLMGRAPDAALPLADGEVVVAPELPEGLEELLDRASVERLDLLAMAHHIRMAGFAREGARAGRLPSLLAFAAYDVDGPEPGIDEDLDSTTLGAGLRFPLSASTGARIHQAEASERRAREELREFALSVAQEVRDAWEGLRVARETLALAAAAVGAAEEAYRIVAEAQDAGGATVTDVLEAEDARRGARVRHVAARAGVEIARARLVAATGGVR